MTEVNVSLGDVKIVFPSLKAARDFMDTLANEINSQSKKKRRRTKAPELLSRDDISRILAAHYEATLVPRYTGLLWGGLHRAANQDGLLSIVCIRCDAYVYGPHRDWQVDCVHMDPYLRIETASMLACGQQIRRYDGRVIGKLRKELIGVLMDELESKQT